MKNCLIGFRSEPPRPIARRQQWFEAENWADEWGGVSVGANPKNREAVVALVHERALFHCFSRRESKNREAVFAVDAEAASQQGFQSARIQES